MGREDDALFKDLLIGQIPHLTRYARTICRNSRQVEDDVQESLLRAWEYRSSLRDLSKMRPWVFKILRNQLYHSARTRLEEDVLDEHRLDELFVQEAQSASVDLADLLKAVMCLPVEQREALLLVVVEGVSLEDAASICSCRIGTLKSRVSRARAKLLVQFFSHHLDAAVPRSDRKAA